MSHDNEDIDGLQEVLEAMEVSEAFLSCQDIRIKACTKAYKAETMEAIRRTYLGVRRRAWVKARNASESEKA